MAADGGDVIAASLAAVGGLHRFAAQLAYAARTARRNGVDGRFVEPLYAILRDIGAACAPLARPLPTLKFGVGGEYQMNL